MTTTHINKDDFCNKDIISGDYRRIDLFRAPFCSPENPIVRVSDWSSPEPPREMCVWSRSQLIEARSNLGMEL